MPTDLLKVTPSGLYCEPGNFYVDPWKPVNSAIITHAHSDHARWGSRKYLAAETNVHVLRTRLGQQADLTFHPFSVPLKIGSVNVTFVPAGHILGSAQVMIERKGEVVVVSGDYKRESDRTCRDFEPVECHTFVTESTFGLPVYRWSDPRLVFEQIDQWWRQNQEAGKATVLLAYALGKAQRLLAGVDANIGPIYTHGAVEKLNSAYRETGIELPNTTYVGNVEKGTDFSKALIIAPPSAAGTTWMRRFGPVSTGMASGWMQIRGTRRRRSMDRGFVLSDHVNWSSLMQTIAETKAEDVWVTHGYTNIVSRHLSECGYNTAVIICLSQRLSHACASMN